MTGLYDVGKMKSYPANHKEKDKGKMTGNSKTTGTDVIVTGDDSPMVTVDTDNDEFTETSVLPSGRKARAISQVIWDKLEESAKRQIGFSKTGSRGIIDELRKDLASAAVKAKYDVTTGSKDAGKGLITFTFSANYKPAE